MPKGKNTGKGYKMSVNVEATAESMLEPLDSLRKTPTVMQPLHRVWFEVPDTEKWYAIIAEARQLYGQNWNSQRHVKRKLEAWNRVLPVPVWFDVPDPAFATWVSVKCSVIAIKKPGK